MASKNPDLPRIEAYLAALPEESQATLQQIRQTIRELVPDAEEAISYGMPAFKLGGRPIAGYSASRNHCSYFPMSGEVIAALEGEFDGYETSKGGFKFPIGEPPPKSLIEKLLKARIEELAGRKGD